MKILFLVSRIHPDKTSCGLLACKLLSILQHQPGVEIDVVTTDPDIKVNAYNNRYGRIEYLDKCNFLKLEADRSFLLRFFKVLFGFLKRYFVFGHNKLNALFTYSTGYNFYDQVEVRDWKTSIKAALKKDKYDLIFCYGAGHDFFSHMALSQMNVQTPWVANYHDPYPYSLYPPPYATYTPIISPRQEKAHYRILEKATHLSFPCMQLRDWVLMRHKHLLDKSHVIPHPACQLKNLQQLPEDYSVSVNKEKFTILHTGTLLSARDPTWLINAFNRFLGDDAQKREKAELLLIGNVNPRFQKGLATSASENIRIVTKRLSYSRCIELSESSSVLLLIEARSEISPFFPGKLTDYLWLKKPILALSPEVSTTRAMIGNDACSLLEDEDRILNILERLWDDWKANKLKVDYSDKLQQILPPAVSASFMSVVSSKDLQTK